MSDDIHIRGLTWDHPRGLAPLQAASALWAQATGVTVEWRTHSLQGFADALQHDLARDHDLLVFDHPFVGAAAAQGFFTPLDDLLGHEPVAATIAAAVGPSGGSYQYDGQTWALPLDAACHVAAYNPRHLAVTDLPTNWSDVIAFIRALAREGLASTLPLFPVDCANLFFTICAGLGAPALTDDLDRVADRDVAAHALELLAGLSDVVGVSAPSQSPIDVLDEMSTASSIHAYVPALFGYVPYSTPAFRQEQVAFAPPPAPGGILGGAGIAVSAHSRHAAAAGAFAAFVTSGPAQRDLVGYHWGQPAHRLAWDDPTLDARCGGFYSATRDAIERAWLRPRWPGFVPFHTGVANLLHHWLTHRETTSRDLLDDVDRQLRTALAGQPC